MKFLCFFYSCGSLLPSWIQIHILNADPDPETQINADRCRSRYETTLVTDSQVVLHIKNPDQNLFSGSGSAIYKSHTVSTLSPFRKKDLVQMTLCSHVMLKNPQSLKNAGTLSFIYVCNFDSANPRLLPTYRIPYGIS